MPDNFNGYAYCNHILTFKNTDNNTKKLFGSISAFHNRHRLDSIWRKMYHFLSNYHSNVSRYKVLKTAISSMK